VIHCVLEAVGLNNWVLLGVSG